MSDTMVWVGSVKRDINCGISSGKRSTYSSLSYLFIAYTHTHIYINIDTHTHHPGLFNHM